MRVGLFGGSFDPVHYGHLLLAECCREQRGLEEVWFLPAAVPPHQLQRELTPAAARIEMLELAIAGQDSFVVNRYEVERGGVNYTVDTLRHFRNEDASLELFFLLGADMLADLPNWREADQICELATPVVVARPGTAEVDFDALSELATAEKIDRIRKCRVEMPQIDVSSTEIRRRVSQGQSIRYQTPRAVEKYIETQRLYR